MKGLANGLIVADAVINGKELENGDLVETVKSMQDNLDELNWGKMAGGAMLAGALITGTPDIATAKTHHHHHYAVKNYTENDYIRAIVGEASSEGYPGMLAIACAIRNKIKDSEYKYDPLHGVYGKNAGHIDKETAATFDMAKKAWDDSKTRDTTGGAIIWGNNSDVKKWKDEALKNSKFWFNNVEETMTLEGHAFFKVKKRGTK